MSGKMNQHAYENLIAEDLDWLEQYPRTLEREHIAHIVRDSVEHHYPSVEHHYPVEALHARIAALEAERDALRSRLAAAVEALRGFPRMPDGVLSCVSGLPLGWRVMIPLMLQWQANLDAAIESAEGRGETE